MVIMMIMMNNHQISDIDVIVNNLLSKYNITKMPVDTQYISEKEDIKVKFVSFNDDLKNRILSYAKIEERKIVINNNIRADIMGFCIGIELSRFYINKEYALSENYKVLTKDNIFNTINSDAVIFSLKMIVPKFLYLLYKNFGTREELIKAFATNKNIFNMAEKLIF